MRLSTLFIGINAALVAAAFSLVVHAHVCTKNASLADARTAELVRDYGLTDLAVFTEANYTRHPTMTDLNTPFQDSPMSLEHFPSGSLLQPPSHVVEPYAKKY
jgi:hypothetical protein